MTERHHIGPRARSEIIMSTNPEDVRQFHYSSQEEAVAEAAQLLKNLRNTSGIIYYDVDDTLLFSERIVRLWLNFDSRKHFPQFKSVGLAEVQEKGRYQKTRFVHTAERKGKDWDKYFYEVVGGNNQLHSFMVPQRGAVETQQQLTGKGYAVGGYITSRPEDIGLVTASTLQFHGFAPAPLLHPKGYSSNPQDAKIPFVRDIVLPHIPPQLYGRTFIIDDNIETARGIQEECDGKIVPIVAVVKRNQNRVEEMRSEGILHGPIHIIPHIIEATT